MKKYFFIALLLALTLSTPSYAAEAVSPQAEAQAMKAQISDRAQQLLDAPDGVFDVEYAENGTVSRLKIKATTDVSTSLRGNRADRMAKDSAQRKARAAFSQFLGTDVTFVESETEGIQIIEKDKVESAEFTQASSSTITTSSQSFQRGLISLMQHFEGEGDKRICVMVLGWSRKLVVASETAQGSMKRTPTEPASSEGSNQSGGGASGNSGTSTKLGSEDF